MKSVLIRKYGARLIGQPETEQIIIQSLRSQNKLWNALVEIEHRNHEAYAAIVTDSDAEFAALTLEHDVANATLDALYEQRNRKRAAMRTNYSHETYAALRAQANAGQPASLPPEFRTHAASAAPPPQAVRALEHSFESALPSRRRRLSAKCALHP